MAYRYSDAESTAADGANVALGGAVEKEDSEPDRDGSSCCDCGCGCDCDCGCDCGWVGGGKAYCPCGISAAVYDGYCAAETTPFATCCKPPFWCGCWVAGGGAMLDCPGTLQLGP